MKSKKFQSQSEIDVTQIGAKPLADVNDNTYLLTEKDDEDDNDSNGGKGLNATGKINVGRLDDSQDSDENGGSDLKSNYTNPLADFIKSQ